MQLHRTDRLLEKKQNRGHEREVALTFEGFLINPVLMTKAFLHDKVSGVIDTLIEKEYRMRVLHPNVNGRL